MVCQGYVLPTGAGGVVTGGVVVVVVVTGGGKVVTGGVVLVVVTGGVVVVVTGGAVVVVTGAEEGLAEVVTGADVTGVSPVPGVHPARRQTNISRVTRNLFIQILDLHSKACNLSINSGSV